MKIPFWIITSRLVKLQEDTKDKLILIPRIYTNKPRTTGDGYKGMLHQPDPEKRPSMADGLHAIRHLHMRVLMETGLSTADECCIRTMSATWMTLCPILL